MTVILPPKEGLEEFQDKMGRVFYQPISVESHTNKRFTVNYRVPIEQLQFLIPHPIQVEEIRDTGMGLMSYCVCDFGVSKLGALPIKRTQNNEMLLRISVLIPNRGEMKRAYYTIRSDASSKFLGFFGGRFSHFRKAISKVEKFENTDSYKLTLKSKNPICGGYFEGKLDSINKKTPATTIFSNIEEATKFVFEVDGSCGYSFKSKKLSFGEIDYPAWDIYFNHEFDFEFKLLDHIVDKYKLDVEYDSVLFMEKVKATWKKSSLYHENR